MKSTIHILMFAVCFNVNAQITLEHVYDSASTYAIGNPVCQDQLLIVNFEISGYQYVRINRHGKNICIYDMNHSLINIIDYSTFPFNHLYPNDVNILYLSESLFDSDPGKEFIFGTIDGPLGIYNDDGSIIFSDSAAPIVLPNIPIQQYPIYNSPYGTKMILSYKNGQAKVFSLPGTLSTAISEANNNLLTRYSISNAYPNPAISYTNIDYKLPDGINQGEIVLYDLQGKEIKRYNVDRTFNSLLISTDDIPAGSYYYQLQTKAQSSEGKKLIVVE